MTKSMHCTQNKSISGFKIIVLLCICLTAITSCKNEPKTIKIAEQYGLAYAPIQVMKESGYLEELLGDDYTVEWVKLANTAAIREAMLGDSLDVGFMGIPPFLIGVDNQMEWKIISGLSKSPLGLVVNDPSITTLEDLVGDAKIALPQPGSIQHILLTMAAQDELGDPSVFDNQLVSMKHPDGLLALLAGNDISGHFTSPPYIFKELEEENHKLLVSGNEAFGGEFTFIVGVCREEFYNNDVPYAALQEALEKAMDDIDNKNEEALVLLGTSYELDRETLMSYLYHEDMSYGSEVVGVQRFSDFMLDVDYISEAIIEKDVIWNDKN